MVKRAKLTLEHTEARESVEEVVTSESVVTDHPVASSRQRNLGKMLIVVGLSIVSLIIFRQKIF